MKHIVIDEKYKNILGTPDEGTLIYRRDGSDLDFREWSKAVFELTAGYGVVSPGGVPMHCNVSRAALHKKLKTGGLTAFCFHVTETVRTLLGKRSFIQRIPYMYIPVFELEEWEKELLAKMDNKERIGNKTDEIDDYNPGAINERHSLSSGKKWLTKSQCIRD